MLIKTISIRQPWAWAIYHGKPVENRTWYSKYRGPLLVHAGKTFDIEGFHWIIENQAKLNIDGFIPIKSDFQMGGIIGKVNMVACVPLYASPWFFGPWGHVYENQKPLPFFPCKGQPGIFEVDYAE